MKKIALVGILTGLFISPAWSSFDMDESCSFWQPSCDLSAYPFFDANNDTRANMVMLEADKRGFSPVFQVPKSDQRTSQNNPFVIHRSIQDEHENAAASAFGELKKLATQLGVDLIGLNPADNDRYVENNRTISNNQTTLRQFFQVLINDPELTREQRIVLAQIRLDLLVSELENNLVPYAISSSAHVFPEGSHAMMFATYLLSAEQFYRGAFADAKSGFEYLTKVDQPWLAETASYMLLRVALNQSVEHAVDEYGMFDPSKSDAEQVKQVLHQADSYLNSYPNGIYAKSVEGLYRRIYWYMGDTKTLATLSEQALNAATDLESLYTLSNELDMKVLTKYLYYRFDKNFFTSATDTPVLTFTQTLRRLRENYQQQSDAILVTESEIDSYKLMFEKANMLSSWQYLQAARLFYQEKDYAAVESMIEPVENQSIKDPVHFSMQILRGLALLEQNKKAQAETHWRHLLTLESNYTQQQFLQLMLANSLALQKKNEQIFSAESPVINLRYRSIILKRHANAELLREQVVSGVNPLERAIALKTLLTKDLLHGDYAGYLEDRKLASSFVKELTKQDRAQVNLNVFDWNGRNTEAGYYCDSLDNTVGALVKRPNDGHAMNCIGEFIRITDINTLSYYDDTAMLWTLTSAPATFAGTPISRLNLYQKVIADPKAEPEDKSYALYRAVMCYAPSGMNSCDQQNIDLAVRKQWFQTLKKEYPGSIWARKLNYYW